MEKFYINLLLGLALVVILIGFWMWEKGSLMSFETFVDYVDYAPIPYFHRPLLRYFDSEPSGYDAGTRSYYNPAFALEVAQGLDTR